MSQSIEALLRPRSIAILGASADFNKLNGRTLKALIDKDYAGRLYPVNPKYPEIAGLACYPDVASIPGTVDLAVVAVPAKHVPRTLRELGAKRVAAAVIFSSGFSEIGAEGVALERDLKAAIRESGVRVLGPNCLGLISAVSCFGAAAGVRLKELDLNPVLAGHAGATAVDWLLILNQ